MKVRPAALGDLAAVQAIYAHHVRTGLGTFEEEPPSAEDMRQRYEAVRSRGLPWIVAELDGAIAGYAYAGPFRPRAAYRYTVEDSVYVAADRTGRGVGRAMLQALIDECERLGLRQMAAVIGDSGNDASIALHRACGFELKAVLPGLGFKFGRWVDVVWMQRALGPGDGRAPDGPGLNLGGG
jgi:phosphinothricin acetyltransferase